MRPLEPPGVEHHRVAMVAERADLRAPPPRVKGVVAPLDLGHRAHTDLPAMNPGALATRSMP